MSEISVKLVTESDLPDLLPLVRGYCIFYGSTPTDEQLLRISRSLLADPDREGVQLLAREAGGRPVGFASLFWTWETNHGGRVGVMNDLFVAEPARGSGAADALIAACLEHCRSHGVTRLSWQTARDNHRAQAVYDRLGGHREQWLDYWLDAH